MLFEVLEDRRMLATITWANLAGGDWHNAANWDLGRLPESHDDVVIPALEGNQQIVFSTGSAQIQSLNVEEAVRIQGGLLEVTSNVFGAGEFLLGGGTVKSATIAAETNLGVTGGTLDTVTINSDFNIVSGQIASVLNGLTLNGTAILGDATGHGVLRFSGDQTLSGSGTVVFGSGSAANTLWASGSGSTLTIGSGITVRGQRGVIGANTSQLGGSSNVSVINHGVVQADASGFDMTINAGSNADNTGVLRAINGGNLSLTGSGWRSTGTNFADASSTFSINASFDNTDSTLALTGPGFFSYNGTFQGGALSIGNDTTLRIVGGTLGDITINGDFKVVGGQTASVLNGLTLNGTATLGDATGHGVLRFSGNQTLSGSGTVVFGSGSAANTLWASGSGSTLTIGSGITVRGQRGVIGANTSQLGGSSNVSVINHGVVQADASGFDMTINAGSNADNTGVLRAINGGNLSLTGSGWRSTGTNFADASSTFSINASFDNTDSTLALTGPGFFSYNGTFQGGALSIGNDTTLRIVGGTLDGVTVNGDFKVVGGQTASVLNGLTLNGTATLGDATGHGVLRFSGDQTLSGSGTLVFGSGSAANTLWASGSGSTLTIGSGITVRGQRGVIGANTSQLGGSSAGVVVVNNGTIEWTNGTNITVQTVINNSGTITVDASGVLALGGTIRGGSITTQAGSRIHSTTLDGVTINGDFKVVGNSSVTVTNGLTLGGTATLGEGGTYGLFNFSGTQTLSGTGSVVFGSAASRNMLRMTTAGTTLTIGPDVTVRGQSGTLGYSPNFGGPTNVSIVNHGTVEADSAGTITVRTPAGTLQSPGALKATDGNTLAIVSTIVNTENTLNLSGGGTIAIPGTLVQGGIIAIAAGTTFNPSGGTLNAVTINGDWRVNGSSFVTVTNDLTLNGDVTLGDGTGYGVLDFTGSQTLGGTGSVVFGSSNVRNMLRLNTAATTLTVGTNVILRGQTGTLGYSGWFGGPQDVNVVITSPIEWGADTRIYGVIRNAQINVSSGVAINNGAHLDNVTINGDWRVNGNSFVTVTNDLTLNGDVTLGDGTGYGVLDFTGSQTLGGAGSVVFGSSNVRNMLRLNTAAATLTVGTNVILRGQTGTLGYSGWFGGPQDVNVVITSPIEWGADTRIFGVIRNAQINVSSGAAINNGAHLDNVTITACSRRASSTTETTLLGASPSSTTSFRESRRTSIDFIGCHYSRYYGI